MVDYLIICPPIYADMGTGFIFRWLRGGLAILSGAPKHRLNAPAKGKFNARTMPRGAERA